MFKTWKLRRKLSKWTEKAVFDKFDAYVKAKNGHIKSFVYYPKHFGNFTVVVSYMGVDYKFENDRNDIYCNDKFLCNGSYHVAGEFDPPDKVIEFMEEIVFKQQGRPNT